MKFGFNDIKIFWLSLISTALILGAGWFYIAINSRLMGLALSIIFLSAIFLISQKIFGSAADEKGALDKMDAVMKNLNDAIIIYDGNFRIIAFNPSAERIFNLKADEVVNKIFGPERAQNERYKILAQSLYPSLAPTVLSRSEPDQYPQVADIAFEYPDLHLRVATTPIGAEGGRDLFLKVISNRTEEADIQKAKSEFINTAAFQLRAPITNVLWALESLEKGGLPDDKKDLASQGLFAIKRLSKIVTDLLDVSNIESGRLGYIFETGDIASFIGGLVRNAEEYARKAKLKLNINFSDNLGGRVELSFDKNRLGMAMSNLLDNAIRYNVENGTVSVRLERLPGEPYAMISVEDTGIGVPESDTNQISKKFYRSRNAIETVPDGSGLGLFIAKNIIKRHGGSFRIESVLGRGTTVSFTLPTDPKLVPRSEFAYSE